MANILKIDCRLQPTVGDVIFFGPDCSYDPTRPKRSKKPHDRSLFRSLFLGTAGATSDKFKSVAHGASPQIPATAYFGVSFMHTGGVLGVYNARVLLEGTNDGD